MSLPIGSIAPRFKLPCKPGEEVDVGEFLGREKVVLLFFPMAFSSVCSEEMCTFRDSWADWSALGCKVFGICADNLWVTDRFRAELGVPFPILSDFNKTVCESYDALHAQLGPFRGVPKRAAVVIGTDGRIQYAWEAEIPKTQVDFAAVRNAVNSAR